MHGSGTASRAASSERAKRRNSLAFAIERLGHQGDGIADGPVYVPRTLPGEVVSGEVVGDRLENVRIVAPSSERVTPPCRHYKSCGGCALQHAADEFVENWKMEVVRRALMAHGLDAPFRRLTVSPSRSRRRATFSGRRTKNGATIGFHAPSSMSITSVPDCILVRPSMIEALPSLAALAEIGSSRKSELKLAVTETDAGLDVAVSGGKAADLLTQERLISKAREAGFARLTWSDEVLAVFAPPAIHLGRTSVLLPPSAFLQATKEGETALTASVVDALDGAAGPVADLFAGLGTFTLPVLEAFEVHSVEGSHELLIPLEEAWRHGRALRRLSTEARDLFRRPLMADEIRRFGAVIVDPPRAGAEAQFAQIARSGVGRVASVSCNPVTFARDAKILTDAGYRMNWIDVVDQFRWSPHIELVASFSLD